MRAKALDAIAAAGDLRKLDEVRVHYLGRKGALTDVLRGLKDATPEERPKVGQAANDIKEALAAAVEERQAALEQAALAARAESDRVDLTLPGRTPPKGHIHPIEQTLDRMLAVFRELGFQVATGPDIETEYYNFDALNTPADHPARDMHDTFFVKPGVVLRTHTSPVQIRVMERTEPPVAVVIPGRVYRVDSDATHSPMFVQLEGLLVDRDVTFADLKGTLQRFVERFFGEGAETRFRPHFFPFTEPSAEMDVKWTAKDRDGNEKSSWLELLGCGMVHPKVLKAVGYDPEVYTGYAFGMGVDRLAMVRHGIGAIGHLYENDLRFLEQF